MKGAVEVAARLRRLAEANSTEAGGCVAGEELRKAACQGAAQAYRIAAEMIVDRLCSPARAAMPGTLKQSATGHGDSIG